MTAMVVFRYVIWRTLRGLRRRRAAGMLLAVALLALALLGNALAFYLFDGAQDAGITFTDSLWYSIVSVTTIGYGDFSAHTLPARIATIVLVMGVGLAATTMLLGMLVDGFVMLALKERRGLNEILAKDHILIVNYPGEDRVRQIVDEFRDDPLHANRDVVLVTDQVDELPAGLADISFVRGSPLEPATYRQANVGQAREVIVLATGYQDRHSDSVVASSVSIIESLNRDVPTVAECLQERHRRLFETVRCDAVVCTLDLANKLIVQESQDRGVVTFLSKVASNQAEGTLFTMDVGRPPGPGRSYGRLAAAALMHDVNIVSVLRDGTAMTRLAELECRPGDRVVYIADRRVSWQQLLELAR